MGVWRGMGKHLVFNGGEGHIRGFDRIFNFSKRFTKGFICKFRNLGYEVSHVFAQLL